MSMLIGLLAGLQLLMIGCDSKKDKLLDPDCNLDSPINFGTTIAPVIQANCFSCHNNSFKLASISLEGINNVRNVAASGKLLGVINHAPGFPKMPKGGARLDECTIQAIEKWVADGTPE